MSEPLRSRAVPTSQSAPSSASVQSVARAAAILRCFTGTTVAFSLTDIARQTGLSVSTTYRIAKTLCAESLLSYDAVAERYQLGALLVGLGRSAVVSAGLTVGLQILHGLSDRTGESAAINIRQGRNSVAILATNSIQGLRFVDEMGQSVPLHVTAAGKALLAFGPESPADAVKGLGRLERLTERTMSTRSTLLRDLKESVARGFTVCDEEREQGVRAIGVPILDDRGVARAAVGIQGPIFRIPDARIPELADILGMAAKECSAALDLDRLA